MLNNDLWPRYFIGFDRMLANFPAPTNNTDGFLNKGEQHD